MRPKRRKNTQKEYDDFEKKISDNIHRIHNKSQQLQTENERLKSVVSKRIKTIQNR